ncbi:MAG TPA: sigma-70 family RNA polymerase sigma factor [Opitutaceae bacterium]|jgi:RNA polymerase sigma factor (sigma-70 family)|nr:sigma-70 family RNA polymerase sigma factor [Opitutaceae bacterium]
MEDAQLLCRYLENRSEEAFTELVRRHVDLVYFAALRRVGGDRHLADDVTQSVFTDLARKAPSLKNRTVLTGWLYTSTRFAAAQAVRTEQRRRTHEQEAQTMNELHSTPEPGWDQLRPIIDEAMDELNEREREVILLRFFENLPLAEVGAKFSLSPDAARMRIDRALDKLRGLLAKRGIASTSVALAAIFASQSGLAAPSGLVAKIVTGVLSQAGTIATATFGLWKIMTGVAIAALGTGVVVYEANRSHPPVISSGPASEVSRIGQNPIDQAAPATNGPSQAVDHSNAVQPKLAPADANVEARIAETAFRRKMKTDTAYRASIIALAKSRLDLFYGPLFKTLNLPATRLDQFKDLLIKKQMVDIEVNEAMQTTGVRQEGLPSTELKKLFHQSMVTNERDVENEIKAVLTAPEYGQYLGYGEDLMPWIAVNALARTLQSAATPLADEQTSQLVVLLRESQPKLNVPFSLSILFGSGLFPTTHANPITAEVLAQAGAVLSVPQMEALRQIQQQWGFQAALGY